jgi:ABC-type ATPase involved in cell division
MYLIELSDYHFGAIGAGSDFDGIYFSLSKSDICQIETDSTDDAHNFLKALATLVYPVSGSYRFMGEEINFSDYRKLLPIKKKIGYIGQDATMVSNRTIRENLLLMRCYYENSLSISLDEEAARLCEMANLKNKLDVRPGELRPDDLRMAVAIRELTKSFEVLLLDCPEDYFGPSIHDPFDEIFSDIDRTGKAAVFFSRNHEFAKTYSNRKILLAKGHLTKVPL